MEVLHPSLKIDRGIICKLCIQKLLQSANGEPEASQTYALCYQEATHCLGCEEIEVWGQREALSYKTGDVETLSSGFLDQHLTRAEECKAETPRML